MHTPLERKKVGLLSIYTSHHDWKVFPMNYPNGCNVEEGSPPFPALVLKAFDTLPNSSNFIAIYHLADLPLTTYREMESLGQKSR